MTAKELVDKMVTSKREEVEELVKRSAESEDIDEVKSINERLDVLRKEILEAESVEEPVVREEVLEATEEATEEIPEIVRNIMTTEMVSEVKEEVPVLRSMEYRQAFKDYVQRGVMKEEYSISNIKRDNEVTMTSDVGMLIPETVMEEILKGYEGVYGTIYNRVRHLNVKGGVKFPIGAFNPEMAWITEGQGTGETQKVTADDSVTFTYHVGETKIAVSFLASVVTIDAFEREVAQAIVRAFLKAMDIAIVKGTGEGSPLGLAKDERVTNKIEFTEETITEWTTWRKELFAKVPVGLRGQGMFFFPAGTLETYIMSMKDNNNRPIFRDSVDGAYPLDGTVGRLFGIPTQLVESDVIANFDDAEAGDVIGIYMNPEDYAVNTNYQFTVRRYFDEATNQWITKSLVVVDGKALNTDGIFLLTKGGVVSD